MIALTILASLILVGVIIITVFAFLSYRQLTRMNLLNGTYQADEYRKAVEIQKHKKPTQPVAKQETRGRSVVKTEELVDIADIPWEEGIKVIEELGNG